MKRICIALIRFYQKFLSPLKISCCRFTPTCSRYAIEAVARFGVIKGILLSGYRILRCNPFFSGGYDPVPFRFTFSGKQLPRVTLNTSVSDTSAFFSDNK